MVKESSFIACSFVLAKKRIILLSLTLLVSLLIVWGLGFIPIYIFHKGQFEKEMEEIEPEIEASRTEENDTFFTCNSLVKYKKGKCYPTLVHELKLKGCLPGPDGSIDVLTDEDEQATEYISQINLIGVTAACKKDVIPFLCLFLFGLCGGYNSFIHPTVETCERVRDISCREEWKYAKALGAYLPECRFFPDDVSNCFDQHNNISVNELIGGEEAMYECRNNFFRKDNKSVCEPSCETWSLYEEGKTNLLTSTIIAHDLIGLVALGAVLILCAIRYKALTRFPYSLIVNISITLLILRLFVLIGIFKRKELYCNSPSLRQSLLNVTIFCPTGGMASLYLMQQLWIFWTILISLMCWRLYFPHHYREFIRVKKMRAIYWIVIAVGYLFPIIPAIMPVLSFALVDIKNPFYAAKNTSLIQAGLGYQVVHFPPLLCSPLHYGIVYYTFVMPNNICFLVGGTMLVFLLHYAIRVGFQIKTSDKYLLVVFCYFFFAAIVNQTYYSIILKNFKELIPSIFNYFGCEESGYDANNPCDRTQFEYEVEYVFTIFSHITISLWSITLLMFAFNMHAKKHDDKRLLNITDRHALAKSIKEHFFLYSL